MKRFTIATAFGSLPPGLLGAGLLVMAVELGVFHASEHPASHIAASCAESARAAVDEAAGAEVLLLGDSQVKSGLLPQVIEERTGRPAYNLAVVGGQAASTYYLLDRALRAGARPKAIVVDFFPGLLASDLRINTRNWPELLGVSECLELVALSGDARFVAPLLSQAVLPSLRAARRFGPRSSRRSVGRPTRVARRSRAFFRNWRLNGALRSSRSRPSLRVSRPSPRPRPRRRGSSGPTRGRATAGSASRRT